MPSYTTTTTPPGGPGRPDDPLDYEEQLEEELMTTDINGTFIDLTIDDQAPCPPGQRRPRRNPALGPTEVCLEKASYRDRHGARHRLRPGRVLGHIPPSLITTTATATAVTTDIPISFVRIQRIVQDTATGEVHVRGTPFARNSDLHAMLSRSAAAASRQEVTCLLEIDESDTRRQFDQAIVQVGLVQGVMTVHVLRVTNLQREDWMPESEGSEWLACRWFYKIVYGGETPVEYALVRATPELAGHEALAEPGRRQRQRAEEWSNNHNNNNNSGGHNESSSTTKRWPRFVMDPAELRTRWRGVDTVAGGSHVPFRHVTPASGSGSGTGITTGTTTTGTTTTTTTTNRRLPKQAYTLFDSFCGCGGVSSGARMAGFHVSHAVDSWPAACATYRLNFPTTALYEGTVDDWATQQRTNATAAAAAATPGNTNNNNATLVRADVVHLSPPCQFWSPAHTVAGANDEQNKSALYACNEILRQVRPRVFTLEQTFGILHREHREHFHHLVRSFTDDGHSVRWKVVFLPSWGLPQRRKRLIMIGSCVGEKLPHFPPATHGEGMVEGEGGAEAIQRAAVGLRPFVTMREALSASVPPDDVLTQLGGRPLHPPKTPYSPDAILTRCITTHGGHNYHWAGQRQLTAREFATLQGFSTTHQFRPTDGITAVKKMIGNAFASSVVRVLYAHLAKALLRADGFGEGEEGAGACVPGEGYLCVRTGRVVVPVPVVEIEDEEEDDVQIIGSPRLAARRLTTPERVRPAPMPTPPHTHRHHGRSQIGRLVPMAPTLPALRPPATPQQTPRHRPAALADNTIIIIDDDDDVVETPSVDRTRMRTMPSQSASSAMEVDPPSLVREREQFSVGDRIVIDLTDG